MMAFTHAVLVKHKKRIYQRMCERHQWQTSSYVGVNDPQVIGSWYGMVW